MSFSNRMGVGWCALAAFTVAALGANSGCSGKTLPVGEVMGGESGGGSGGGGTVAGAGAGGGGTVAGGNVSTAGGRFNGAGGGLVMGSGGTALSCNFTVAAPDEGVAGATGETCSCTRRPVRAGNSFMCPMGEGISVTQAVGPEGGVISLSGSESTLGVSVELRIPPNALSERVNINITEMPTPPPDSISDWSPLFRFEPSDLQFALPVKVRIPWASDQTAVDTDKLELFWSSEADGCTLEPVSDNYVNAGFNQGSTRRLGFAIVGMARSPNSACP